MRSISEQNRKEIKSLLSTSKKKSDFQRVQCLWLRIEFNMTAAEISRITNLQPGTVRKIWSEYFRHGKNSLVCKDRGGRRNYHLSREEEKMFLSPYFKKAEKNDILVVSEVKQAYENMVGKEVPKSTIYRLLARHGWKRKRGKKTTEEKLRNLGPNIREYWIEGCAQALHPNRTGNISQQWLNSTLNSMSGTKSL